MLIRSYWGMTLSDEERNNAKVEELDKLIADLQKRRRVGELIKSCRPDIATIIR
jgi:hypothetical protein